MLLLLPIALLACADTPVPEPPPPVVPAAASNAWSEPLHGGLISSDADGVVLWNPEGAHLHIEHVSWAGEHRVLVEDSSRVDPDTRHLYVYDGGMDIVLARSSRQMIDGPVPEQPVWLRGLAPGTNAEQWRTAVPDGALFRVGDNAIVVSQLPVVALLRTADGALLWRVDVPFLQGWHSGREVDISEGKVLVGAGSRLVALDAGTGAIAWARQIDADRMSVEGGTLVAIEAAKSLHLVDVATGETRIRVPWNARTGNLLLDHGTLFAAAEDPTNKIAAYDAATGKLLWDHTAQGWLGPLLADDHLVYARSADAGRATGLAAYDRATGLERWKVDLPTAGPFALEPREGGLLVVMKNDVRSLYAFRRPPPP